MTMAAQGLLNSLLEDDIIDKGYVRNESQSPGSLILC